MEYNKAFFVVVVLKGPPQLLNLNHSEIRIHHVGVILQNGKSRRMSNFEKAIAEYCRKRQTEAVLRINILEDRYWNSIPKKVTSQ